MNWIDRILMRIFSFIVIDSEENGPYMVRYKVFRCPWFKIFLHHILRSDEDLELHDHPWNFVSLILWEGYQEILQRHVEPSIRRVRGGDVIRHRATDAHRLILERPAWTLVCVTGKKRTWGFYDLEDRWISYSDFFDRKYGTGNWVSF